MMSMAGDNPDGTLPDPLSTIVRVVPTEAGANSLGAEIRLAVGSVDTKIMAEPLEPLSW